MTFNKSEMSAEEYQQYKENLRQKAFEAELNRVKKSKKNQQKLVLFSLGFSAILILLLVLIWLYPSNNVKHTETKIVTVHDTIYSNPDTVFIENIVEQQQQLLNFYTIQIGAYSKQEMPTFLSNDLEFPLIEYQHSNLNCFAFGQFSKIQEAKEARDFLMKIGFSTAIIVEIKDNKRVALIK